MIDNKESFLRLMNDTIKNEIAYFNLSNTYYGTENNGSKTEVNEIHFTKCTENSIQFIVGDIFNTSLIVNVEASVFQRANHILTFDSTGEHKLILIDKRPFWGTNGAIPNKKVNFLRSLHGSHVTAKIPDSALVGIYEPNFCNTIFVGGKKKTTSNCRLYLSKDNTRRYISMLIGKGENMFEVVWIIKNCKYYGRTIDKLVLN